MGQVCKIFLEWNEPWWAPNEGGIQLAWPSDYNTSSFSRNSLRSPHYNGFSASEDAERHWYRGLCNFSEVENHPNLLVTWLAGDAARIADKLNDDEVIN